MEHKTKRGRKWLLSLLALTATCLYPCLFLFAQNAGEARAQDMIPFFLLFLATALAALAVYGLILRDVSRAAVMSCLSMLAVINFTLLTDAIERKIPWLYSRYVMILTCLILLGLLILLLRKKPQLTAVCGIIALTFGVLSLMSVIQAVPKLIQAASYDPPRRAENAEIELTGESRNVYYLLFDEYGGDENLQYYFSFDNSDFYAELEKRGFSASHTSRNPESCWTDTLVPNMLNLDYVADDSMPEKVRRAYLEDPFLIRIFRQNGYRIHMINHRAFLRIRGVRELTAGQTEDNISEYLFRNSIYCKLPWIRDQITLWMFRNYRDHYKEPLENALTALRSCAEKTDGPTLTVSYIQCPHAPFVYNADGTTRDLSTGWYWRDHSLYPGQLQYINSVILETVDNIQREDPDAVILLLSDHGARVSLHMVEQFGGPRFDAAAETAVMQNMLCCVYIPGQRIDIEGDTAINATRKTLDAVFGTSFGTVPAKTGYILPEYYNAKEEN